MRGPALCTYSQSIDRDDSKLVLVNVDMGAGSLRIASGTDKLAAADFQYSGVSSKPEVAVYQRGWSRAAS